jgi:hypothetical protein
VLRFCSFLFNLRAVGREVVKMLPKRSPDDEPSPSLDAPASHRELVQAFRKTEYRVDGPAGPFCLRVDQRCSKVDDLLRESQTTSWAYVTACNPGSKRLTAEENAARLAELERELTAKGLKFYRGEGIGADGAWPPEPSVLVLGISREAAVELARKHGQLAILFGTAGQAAQLLWV